MGQIFVAFSEYLNFNVPGKVKHNYKQIFYFYFDNIFDDFGDNFGRITYMDNYVGNFRNFSKLF